MDPTTCFNEMMDAYERGIPDEASEYAENLAEWLDRGGFPPELHISTDGMKVLVVDKNLARTISQAACQLVMHPHGAEWRPS